MKQASLWALLAVSTFALGCGGSGSDAGPGKIVGPVKGNTITVHSGMSVAALSSSIGAAFVLLSDSPDICGEFKSHTSVQNQEYAAISLFKDKSVQPVVPDAGTYVIKATSGNAAELTITKRDATCAQVSAESDHAASGTVTVTKASGDLYEGTFDVTLVGGDHITGTFNPEACTGAVDGPAQACVAP